MDDDLVKPQRRYQGNLISILIRDYFECNVKIMSTINVDIRCNYVPYDTEEAGMKNEIIWQWIHFNGSLATAQLLKGIIEEEQSGWLNWNLLLYLDWSELSSIARIFTFLIANKSFSCTSSFA